MPPRWARPLQRPQDVTAVEGVAPEHSVTWPVTRLNVCGLSIAPPPPRTINGSTDTRPKRQLRRRPLRGLKAKGPRKLSLPPTSSKVPQLSCLQKRQFKVLQEIGCILLLLQNQKLKRINTTQGSLCGRISTLSSQSCVIIIPRVFEGLSYSTLCAKSPRRRPGFRET